MEAGFIPVGGAAGGVAPAPQAVTMNPGNVIRAPGLKRGKVEEAISDRIKLETVLGLTVGSNAALDCDPNTEVVAYPAGCTVVLYNVRKNRQSHLLNSSRKSVTCVAFSPDGRYLATGECGHAPAVRVWDLQDPSASGAVQIAEFPGHTHGVSCVAFSTSSKYLVSVGSQHDMIVNVWDWRSNLKLASNKVSSRVKAVSFSENGNYFVTVGFRHVKFWYLEYSRNNKIKEPVPLMGRSAILGEQKDNEFCDVSCGRGACADSTYAITRGGLLCEFNSRRLLDKWVELRTQSANCMSLGSEYIFVGCAEGLVRCFSPQSLRYVTTLPRAHYLGVDVAQGTDISHMYRVPSGARWADALALAYDETHHKLTAVYNDHSLYVWDLRDIKRVGKSHSALYHSACIWGVDMLTSGDTSLLLTCSSDDTVRMWGWQRQGPLNVYSNELAKVLYIDPELKFLKDQDLTASSDKDKSKSYDDKIGVRCVRVSPNGNHIASGDRSGNVLIHSSAGSLLHTLEAHDAEVLCVEYSPGVPALLASASRDRLIHVFDVEQGYQILQTLDDHSSSITAVRFLQHSGTLQMVSCGADKTILFRTLVNSGGVYQFSRASHASGRATLYDMEVDAGGRHVLTACQDRNVRVYSAATGRHTKTFRGTTAEDGTLIKVALDSSGIYLATSSTDKVLSVYDYYSGECMATMYGHSEIVTGLRFTPDCSHLISAGGDGCIFIWRVPHDMCVTMRARLAQQAIRTGKKVPSNGLMSAESEVESALGSPPRELQRVPTDYTLRIGRLPSWAAKSLGDETSVPAPTPPVAPPPPARGKWAKRINTCDKRIDSDGSKDSSIDSGTDTRYFEKRRDQTAVKQVTLVVKSRLPDGRTRHHTDDSSLGSLKYEDQESTEHDGDIEDISDGERTSSSESRNRPTYYPGNTSDAAGDFTVNAMDVEELRASQRRSKRWRPEARLELSAATSVNTSPQHSDEDDVSTPSGDNEPQRNPLGGSCESIDVAARREKYMKSAFDSLSGAETEAKGVTGGSTSLSSQHLSPRAPPSGEAARRRQELNRRILDTRRQLESLGYRSNLKSSQSTTDLSYIPEKEQNSRRNRPVSTASPNSGRGFASSRSHLSPYDRESEESGGMRRAISLSDLAVTPTPAPRSNTGNTAKQAPPSPSQPNKSPAVFARPAPRYNKGNITRSSSVGVLNQSDSESDGQPSRPRAAAGVLRPTISSMNKAAAPARRRPLNNAYSTVNLSTTATRDDSSSEAEERPGGRARAVSVDHTAQRRIGRSGSERELSARAREVTNRLAGVRPRTDAKSEPAEAQLSSRQLCSALTEQLTRTANKVVHLYRTLHDPGQDGGSGDNHVLISGLEAAMLETQKVLRGAVERQLSPAAGTDSRTDRTDGRTDRTDAALSTADTTRLKLEELVSKESTSGNPAMSLIEQYSDILLNMMQNKIVSQLQSPQSLPPDGGGS